MVTLPFTETFTGTTGAAWSTNWTTRSGTATIQANAGQLTTAAVAYGIGRSDLTGMSVTGDTDVTGTLVLPATGGVEQYALVSLNGDGNGVNDSPTNSYGLTFSWPDQQVKLRTTINGTNTTVVVAAKTLTGGVTYSFRVQRIGQVLNGRVWTGTEPATWDLTYTLTGTPMTGIVGLAVGNGADGVARSGSYDNVTVSVPSAGTAQTATVSLAGAGSLSSLSTVKAAGSASLSGTGSLSSLSTVKAAGSASLSGTGSVSGSPRITATIAASGTGTLSASSAPKAAVPVAASGTGVLTVSTQSNVTGGRPKIWTGTAWVAKPAKLWNGSAWVIKPVKRWNGTSWVPAT